MDADFLVIGAGVAGLRAAIELAGAGTVLVVAKDALRESSSEYAQGGIAVALGEDDEPALHAEDTLRAGDGLCDEAAVRALVEAGPAAIRQLIDWGAAFDRDAAGRLAFTREGAHCRDRVLHAGGDSTGREIARTLYRKAASLPNAAFRIYSAVTDLLIEDGAAAGATVYEEATGRLTPLRARAVLLATGGLGRVYLETTNPDIATGDGVAMAWRAGAEISDIEFVQFHPTALHVEGAPRFLLSEALRGEGALLRNGAGERFTDELAPRDVVSRAIVAEMRRTGALVYLDLTHRGGEFIRARFPRIYQTCLRYGIDLGRQSVPVHPAAHYAMGGVAADIDGRTGVPRLFAAGECASNGVHGANRLASNSLLEAVVFGARAGAAMRETAAQASHPRPAGGAPAPLFPCVAAMEVRRVAWEDCGIARSADRLRAAAAWLDGISPAPAQAGVAQFELRSIHEVARLIAQCALAREESRGAHYRTDFPDQSAAFQSHSRVRRGYDVTFR